MSTRLELLTRGKSEHRNGGVLKYVYRTEIIQQVRLEITLPASERNFHIALCPMLKRTIQHFT